MSRGRLNDGVELVSARTAGGAGHREVEDAAVSDDGRYVAFTTRSSDMLAGITDGPETKDVFVRDVAAGTTTLVTHTPDGTRAVGGAGEDIAISGGDPAATGPRLPSPPWTPPP